MFSFTSRQYFTTCTVAIYKWPNYMTDMWWWWWWNVAAGTKEFFTVPTLLKSTWRALKMLYREVNLGEVTPFCLSLSSATSQALIDLFRPCPIVSSKVFQFVFLHLVYKFSVIFAILLLFILVTCRRQMDLYLLSFSSAGSTFSSSRVFFITFVLKNGAPDCYSEKFHLDWHRPFFIIFF
jgi:hypothetical protein